MVIVMKNCNTSNYFSFRFFLDWKGFLEVKQYKYPYDKVETYVFVRPVAQLKCLVMSAQEAE